MSSFRHNSGFGKRMEYYLIGLMLKEDIDVYVPLVDDNGIDAVIRKSDGSFIEVQIKARSENVKLGDAALFAAITHEYRENYYFVFYSDRLKKTWILTSEEFIEESSQNKKGKNTGKRSIWFNGCKLNEEKTEKVEYMFERYSRYEVFNFDKLK